MQLEHGNGWIGNVFGLQFTRFEEEDRATAVADPSWGGGGGGGGGGTQGTSPLEPSNALLLGRGLAVATYISLTSHLLPPESRLLASYTTH